MKQSEYRCDSEQGGGGWRLESSGRGDGGV